MNHFDVAVLGGGISGLTAGFLLSHLGRSVAVFERSSDPGGCIRTWRRDGYLFELGPNTVLNNAREIDALIESCGLEGERISADRKAARRYVVKDGRLVALPSGPFSFLLTPLFNWRAKLRLLKEPFIAAAPEDAEESIAAFTRRRLGEEFLRYAVGPFVSGVYAGDPERLSVIHATRKIHALERRHGSLIRGAFAKKKGPAPSGGLLSFRGGLDALPRRMAAELGEGWRPEHDVLGVERRGTGYRVRFTAGGREEACSARVVISALSAGASGSILAEAAPAFARRSAEVSHADVAIVCMGFRRNQIRHPLDGFGLLAPDHEGRYPLGCLFPSAIFSGRAPEGAASLTAFVGGAMHGDRVGEDDESILSRTLEDLGGLLGIDGRPEIARVERWRPAIPQYVIGHGDLKAAAASSERDSPGLFLSGNTLLGISVADCVVHAHAVAARADAFLSEHFS